MQPHHEGLALPNCCPLTPRKGPNSLHNPWTKLFLFHGRNEMAIVAVKGLSKTGGDRRSLLVLILDAWAIKWLTCQKRIMKNIIGAI